MSMELDTKPALEILDEKEKGSKRPREESGSGLKQKPVEDLVKYFSKYDDSEFPYYGKRGNFEYKNEAYRMLEAQIQIYKEKSRNLSNYDAIAPPPRSMITGAIVPLHISDDVRPTLESLSKLALDYYHANNNNQGPTFVFHGLVKCTHALINGRIYYITFTAKAEQDPSDSPDITTFQAEVCSERDKQPVVNECAIKPPEIRECATTI